MFASVMNFLANFLVVLVGMTLFILPFAAVFAYRHRVAIREKRPHFNQFMERFFTSREGNWLVFTWAAAEAVCWYIIPEFLLVLVVFMRIRRKFDLVKYDFLGTIAGTLVAFAWHIPQHIFLRVPYVRPRMLEQVNTWFHHLGVWGLFYQPFSGVPYKVFTHQAPSYHFFILWFLIVAIVARMIRYLVIYAGTVAIYPAAHRYVQKHYAILFVAACLIFTGLLMHVVALYS